jgi:hypothetical protein
VTTDAFGMVLLAAAGFVAGVVNAMAGGGSLLTVPVLVMLGLPGTVANGTNRIAVLVQGVVGAWRFRAEGVSGLRGAAPVLLPLLAGAGAGALLVSRLPDRLFERLFGALMLVFLVPLLRRRGWSPPPTPRRRWSARASVAAFAGIGVYGGSVQAGVGLFLLLALARAGYGLVPANAIKSVAIAAFTALTVLVFVLSDQVVWLPAGVLSLGTALGADLGARLAVRGGEPVIRPVLALAVLVLAARMLGVV